MSDRKPMPTYDPNRVREISVAVYKRELGEDDTRRMLEKDADDGSKLRGRAQAYDALTRSYLDVLNEIGLIQRR